jgi:hypothetical protein
LPNWFEIKRGKSKIKKKKNILVFLSLNLNFKRNSKFFLKPFIKNKKNNEEEDSDK